VSDLVFFLDKIKLLTNGWVVFVLVFADLEEYFNSILCPLLQVIRFVQDISELIKYL
jgi:hypothetical protein